MKNRHIICSLLEVQEPLKELRSLPLGATRQIRRLGAAIAL